MSLFQIALPASAMASGLISGFIISHTDGALGLAGWKWLYHTIININKTIINKNNNNNSNNEIDSYLINNKNSLMMIKFIVEGVPTVCLGFIVLWLLPNSPHDAKFLNNQEIILLQKLQKSDIEQQKHLQIKSKEERRKQIIFTLTSPRNWLLSFIGFFLMITSAGIGGYLPSLISNNII